MNINEARTICQAFANKHKLIFDDGGECGFMRECVGFRTKSGNWLDYNPCNMGGNYEPIVGLQCDATRPPKETPDAYHKHDCMAVLGRGDDAIIQLAHWVKSMESAGTVEVVQYDTGATGVQAIFSGAMSYAVVVR